MLSDPETITISAAPISLPRTGSGVSSGTFMSSDGTLKLDISHQYGKRFRRVIRVTQNKVSADPLVPSQNVRSSMSTFIVFDVPVNGYTSAEAKAVVDGLTAWLTASSGANVTKVLGGES